MNEFAEIPSPAEGKMEFPEGWAPAPLPPGVPRTREGKLDPQKPYDFNGEPGYRQGRFDTIVSEASPVSGSRVFVGFSNTATKIIPPSPGKKKPVHLRVGIPPGYALAIYARTTQGGKIIEKDQYAFLVELEE